uniref:Calponin-homology (CH) domain-containing protein n=1 Tax=Graphocephala atropunctata TaxID=36148 RepID=A0A1B6KFQ1_9HEMI
MIGIIQDWLLSQLAINFNIDSIADNNIFQDGCAFANILQKYGLLNGNYYNLNVIPNKDPEQCKANLKLLKPIFDVMGVNFDQNVTKGIVENNSSVILKLLYELYICLESKQHLYFIKTQNYDKIHKNLIQKLDEKNISVSPGELDHYSETFCLEQSLIKNKDIIDWYRNKYKLIKSGLDKKLERVKEELCREKEVNISKHKTSMCSYACNDKEAKHFLPDLNSFLKHSNENELLNYDQFIAVFKKKLKLNEARENLENTIQNDLLSETWSKIMEKQKEIHNTVFSGILLKQSQYEKQIVSKLIQTQSQIKIQNENKIQVDKNLLNDQEAQLACDFELKEEFETLQNIYNSEQKRVLELHNKLYREKQNLIKQRRFSLCGDIVEALIDLAVSASEYKSNYGVFVPKSLWNDWMKLFFKSQPIHIPFQLMESNILDGKSINYDDIINFEKVHDAILNENDVEEYLFTYGGWFYQDVGLEQERLNDDCVAFIVYRLLSLKYPPPSPPLPAELPPFKSAGILLDVNNADCIEKLKILLSKPCVLVFDTETAIKKSIDTFLRETAPPVEGKTKGKEQKKESTKNKLKDKGSEKSTKKESKKKPGKKLTTLQKGDNQEKLINVSDKETQTSIIKEEEDKGPVRTNLGLIGETVSFKLQSGELIDDDLLTSVIIEYLKTLDGNEGWLLINYPLTINQAFLLELALTGKYLPINDYVFETNEEVQEDQDEFFDKRQSKLYFNPINDKDSLLFKTYFSVFIKAKENITDSQKLKQSVTKSSSLSQHVNGLEKVDQELEILPQDLLGQIYTDQLIYQEFSYDSFDVTTLKKLARIILKSDGIEAVNSVDLFGEESLNKLNKGKKKDGRGKGSQPNKKKKSGEKDKKKGGKGKTSDHVESSANVIATDNIVTDLENKDINTESTDLDIKTINPGEKDWQYVSMPINSELAVLLATMWENIETCYVNNLQDIFFENRIISLRLVPYSSYVQEEVKNIMNTDDLKQNVVDIFKNDFNSIERYLRELPNVKCQLHCKVLEMQEILWQLADKKKEEGENKRQEVIYQNWLVNQICMLINNYLSFVQTELSRSIETMKLVTDYYLSMLGRDLPSISNKQPGHSHISKLTEEELLLVQDDSIHGSIPKNSLISSISNYSQINDAKGTKSNFVAQSLIHCTEKEKTLKLLRVHLNKEILKAVSIIDSTSTIFYNQIKTEEHLLISENKKIEKDKKTNKTTTSNKTISEKSKIQGSILKPNSELETCKTRPEVELLLIEWKFVIETEIKRFHFRMDLIKSRCNEDIMEFYCYLESVFCDLHSIILSKHTVDIENINSLCDYIRIAIEEETALDLPLVLNENSFYIKVVEGLKTKSMSKVKELYEESSDFSFTINQLNLLLNIFKIAGPNGVIRKQPFCYILQDLMLFDTGDHQPHLPKVWNQLSESQLMFVVDKMFGLEFAIDWRDFIIYNLEIFYPSVCDILSLRQQFLFYDPMNTEVISLENFATIKLWFENDLPGTPQAGLRIMLVKHLLADMFKVDDKNFNYTALLLYFCKDLDPKVGLRKALSLSIGKNVIISTEEVEEILMNEAEIKNTVHNLLSDVIISIVNNREGLLINEISDTESETNLSFDEKCESHTSSFSSSSQIKSDKISTKSTLSMGEIQRNKSSISLISLSSKQEDDDKQWTSRVPVASVISVLNASFLHQDKTHTLRNIYLNCLEEEADDKCMIEAPKLVNLRCIKKIFELSNKFKISIPQKIFKL